MAGREKQAERTRGGDEVGEGISTVVLVVGSETNPRRPAEILRWVRALVPAALILVSSVPLALGSTGDVINVNVDEVDAGPLSIAAALARPRGGHE